MPPWQQLSLHGHPAIVLPLRSNTQAASGTFRYSIMSISFPFSPLDGFFSYPLHPRVSPWRLPRS